jgi:hypothetical protein
MFSPTDQSHFRKYLATLGVAIVVGSLGLGGYYLQAQSDLLISLDQISKLTPTAQAALRKKQDIILAAAQFAPWVIGILLLVDIWISVTGLVGWSKRQSVIDRKDDLELNKLDAEYRAMTNPEKEKKAQLEAIDLLSAEIVALTESDERETEPLDASEETPSGEKTTEPTAPVEYAGADPHNIKSMPSLMSEVVRAETLLSRKLIASFGGGHVLTGARISTELSKGWLEVDALVVREHRRKQAPMLFELKLIRRPGSVSRTLTSALTHIALAAEFVEVGLAPDPLAIAVILIDEKTIGMDSLSRLKIEIKNQARVIRTALARPPIVLTYGVTEFESLKPESFREAINSAARELGLEPESSQGD